jgi:outer membrane protein assembly factor BamB
MDLTKRAEAFLVNRKIIFPTILVLVLASLLYAGGTEGSGHANFDWPLRRGPNGDGVSQETGWNPEAVDGGPKILWRTMVGFGHSGITIKDNRLYTMGRSRDGETVICLNAETGEVTWTCRFESKLFDIDTQSTPTIHGKFVYAMNNRGLLLCIRAKTGKLKWAKNLVAECGVVKPHYNFSSSPVIEGDLIILTANTSGLALDKNTGKIMWNSSKPPENKTWTSSSTGTDHSTPVLYGHKGKRSAMLSSYQGLHGVDINTGEVLWVYEWEAYRRQVADPLLFDNKVFATHYGGFGCVLLDIGGDEPQVLWKNMNMSSDTSSPVLVDGYLYGCDGGPEMEVSTSLRCLDVQTGEVRWETELRAQGELLRPKTISLIAADGKLIILEDDGTLHIAKATPSSYREISSCDVLKGERTKRMFWSHPVLCNGRIYCRNYSGDLICIDVGN